MGLTMRERHAVTRELTERYRKATKKQQGVLLNDFCALTGYSRYHARFLLRNCGREFTKTVGAKRVVFICAQARAEGAARKRPRRYGGAAFLEALKRLWALSDGLCGKRLKAFLTETIPHLERCGTLEEIVPSRQILAQLETVSAATLDRLLAASKQEARLKGRSSGTRAGSLLKHQIPIRTFAQWNETAPGFCEVDLVAHDGGAAFGQYCQTLTLTDVATGWTETKAVQNKAECHVFAALGQIRAQLPFALLGLDSDNGGEFINDNLVRYCHKEQITFTRSREYRKNDNCFVEQKNNSVVRRFVGYYRFDTREQLALLNAFYDRLRLYTNFFLPVMRLKEKHRDGSRLTRRYDEPRTSYRRLLNHPELAPERKELLEAQYARLNLVTLKRELNRLQAQLIESALAAPPLPKRWAPPADHPWRQSNERIIQEALARAPQKAPSGTAESLQQRTACP
jgi:hypothetical protein